VLNVRLCYEGHVILRILWWGIQCLTYYYFRKNACLSRHGDQSLIRNEIFVKRGEQNRTLKAIITYPDTKTQNTSKYRIYDHELIVVDEYANGNLISIITTRQDITTMNRTKSLNSDKVVSSAAPNYCRTRNNTSGDLSSVDTNNMKDGIGWRII